MSLKYQIVKIRLSERYLVKGLYHLLYSPQGQNRYRLDGVPRDEFLNYFKRPVLKDALTNPYNWKDVEEFKKLDFYLEACIEKGLIKNVDGKLKLTAAGYELTKWYHWFNASRDIPLFIALLSLVVAIWTAYFTNAQVKLVQEQVQISERQASATFLIDLNNQLRNGSSSYSDIIYALATGQSLKAFSDEKKDNYLVMWDLIDSLVEYKIIDSDSAYDAFSYDVEQAYCSPDIRTFILSVRKQDATNAADYGGFTNLGRQFLLIDGNKPCSADFIDNQSY